MAGDQMIKTSKNIPENSCIKCKFASDVRHMICFSYLARPRPVFNENLEPIIWGDHGFIDCKAESNINQPRFVYEDKTIAVIASNNEYIIQEKDCPMFELKA